MGTVLEDLTQLQGQGLVSCGLDMESWTVGREGEAMGVAAETVRAGCALLPDPAHLGLKQHKNDTHQHGSQSFMV